MTNYELPTTIDLRRCVLWQYNKASRIQRIINSIKESGEACSVDPWKKLPFLFNLKDVVTEEDDLDLREIGFSMISFLFGIELPNLNKSTLTRIQKLEATRRLLLGKIYLIDSDGSVPDINEYLGIVFPDVRPFIIETSALQSGSFAMAIACIVPKMTEVTFPISWYIMHNVDYIPRPAGVLIGTPVEIKNFVYTTQTYTDNSESVTESKESIYNSGRNTFDNSSFEEENK